MDTPNIRRRAATLTYASPVADWARIFPSAEALADFALLIAKDTHPGTYGASPYEAASSLAFAIVRGVTGSTARFNRMARDRYDADPHRLRWPSPHDAERIYRAYGLSTFRVSRPLHPRPGIDGHREDAFRELNDDGTYADVARPTAAAE